jgi:hypothetical protein
MRRGRPDRRVGLAAVILVVQMAVADPLDGVDRRTVKLWSGEQYVAR